MAAADEEQGPPGVLTHGRWYHRVYGIQDVRTAHGQRLCGTPLRGDYNFLENPLFVMPAKSPVRVFLVKVVDHPWFDRVILAVVLLNVLQQLCDIPSLEGKHWARSVTTYGDPAFLIIFFVEMMVKVLALGFVLHPRSYLRDAWNVADFVIVLSGIFALFYGSNLNILRLVRLLRPLRAVRRVRGMRVLVLTVVQAIPMMLDVLTLLFLVMYVFAVLGIQMWKGVLHQRCVVDTAVVRGFDVEIVSSLSEDDGGICGARECRNSTEAGVANPECRVDTALYVETIFTFDHILNALLLVFKVVTLDDWPDNLQAIQEASSEAAWVYFVLLTLIGGYFCLNLVLAILAVVYKESQRARLSVTEPVVAPRAEVPVRLTASEEAHVEDKLSKWRRHVEETNRHEGRRVYQEGVHKISAKQMLKKAFAGAASQHKHDDAPEEGARDVVAQEPVGGDGSGAAEHTRYISGDLSCNTLSGWVLMHTVGAVAVPQQLLPPHDDFISEYSDTLDGGSTCRGADEATAPEASNAPSLGGSSETNEGEDDDRPSCWPLRRPVLTVVESKAFSYAMLGVTFVNVAVMAADHHGAPETYRTVSDNTSVIASWCFLLEMVMKMAALGVTGYLRDGYNIMDCVLVLLSLPELFDLGVNLTAFTALRAFRGFRLMVRIQPLRQTVTGIVNAFVAVLWLLTLLLLLTFIYAMLGLNLFRDTYADGDRENFRSLWEACVAVFIVITGDSWATLMKKAMDGSSYAAALYFLSLFCIGNLVLTNLFIAILIDRFEVDDSGGAEDAAYLGDAAGAARASARGALSRGKAPLSPSSSPKATPARPAADPDGELRTGLDRLEQQKWRAQWCGGWRASFSDKHQRPYWWKAGVGRLWVSPLVPLESHTLTDAERRELTRLRGGRGEAEASSPPMTPERLAGVKGWEEDGAPGPVELCPYVPSPWEMRALMNSTLRNALAEDAAGNLRLFELCATERTRVYMEQIWRVGGQSKRMFLQALGDAGVLTPAEAPPLRASATLRLRERQRVQGGYGATGAASVRSGCAPASSADVQEEFENLPPAEKIDARLERCAPRSLGLFPRSNRVRRWLAGVVLHDRFEACVVAVIFINAIFLALDDYYVDDRPGGRLVLEYANLVFGFLYVAEMAAKILVMGFLGRAGEAHPDGERSAAYLTETWNRIDFVIVMWMLLELWGAPFTLNLRCVRTLRILIRVEALKVVVEALMKAAPQIVYICLVCLFVWLVFGILGVQLFKGHYARCSDGSFASPAECLTEPDPRTGEARAWRNGEVHFDHLGMAFLALFEVAVVEGWADIMWAGVDGNEYGSAPVKNAHPHMTLFFVGFVVVGNFFCVNLFIGTLINRFNSDMESLLTRSQAKDAAYTRLMQLYSLPWVPIRPTSYLRRKCYDLQQHKYFDPLVLIAILLNCALLGTERYGQGEGWDRVLEVGDYVFVFAFFLEMVVKGMGLGLVGYLREAWNRFDCVCVMAALLGIFFDTGASAGAFRLLRVFRAFRLLKKARGLNLLFHTMIRSLPSLGNILLLLLYIFFNWGVVGVGLFKNLADNPLLGAHRNFRTLPNAVLVLYQIGTTESWTDVMEGTSLTPPACDRSIPGHCGKEWGHWVYFVSYMVVGSFVVMNLFVFVVLNNFENDRIDLQSQGSDTQRGEMHRGFAILRDAWEAECQQVRKTDRLTGGTNRLDVDTLIAIVQTIPEPVWTRPAQVFLRAPTACRWLNLIRNIKTLPVPVPLYRPRRLNGQFQVEYDDVLRALAMRVVGMKKAELYGGGEALLREANLWGVGKEDAFDLLDLIAARRVVNIWRSPYRSEKTAERRKRDMRALQAVAKGEARAEGGPEKPPQPPSTPQPVPCALPPLNSSCGSPTAAAAPASTDTSEAPPAGEGLAFAASESADTDELMDSLFVPCSSLRVGAPAMAAEGAVPAAADRGIANTGGSCGDRA